MEAGTTISRRAFAIGGVAALAGIAGASAVSLAGCSPSGSGSNAKAASDLVSSGGSVLFDGESMDWTHEADIVVVGCGGAGAAAALMAKDAGSEVIVLEKGVASGGCTALCGQAIAVGGSHVQKEMGIEDTPEDFKEFLLAVTQADPDLMGVVADNCLDTYTWLESLGVTTPAVEGVPGITFGGSHEFTPFVPRTHWTEGIWKHMEEALSNEGIEVMKKTPATALVTDVGTGEVVGVVAEDGSEQLVIKAKKAVILAAGGFTNNPEMIKEHITTRTYVSFSSLTDDGDGLLLGQSVGAGVSYLNCGNDASAYVDPPAACIYLIESAPVANDPGYIAVNKKGKRFVDESNFQVMVNRAIMAQPDGMCFVIAGGEDGVAGFTDGQTPSSLVTSDTVEGLASAIGVDEKTLVDTIATWNESCAKEEDPAFGRSRSFKPLDTPPFSAAEVFPGFSSTLSGLSVDVEMKVLQVLTKEPIGRLYAAGANGNTVGRVYACCGLGVAAAIATGRVAGVNAAKLEPWS